jgi:predicted GNAT family acetyltransferase
MMADDARVIHNTDTQAFEIENAGGTAVLTYRELGDHLTILHTEVGPEHEGKGYGGLLVRAVLDYARKLKCASFPRASSPARTSRVTANTPISSTRRDRMCRSPRHPTAAETSPTIAPPATSHVTLTR